MPNHCIRIGLSARFFYIFKPLLSQQLQHLVPVVALNDDNAVFGIATGCALVFQQLSQLFQLRIGSNKAFDDGGFLAAFAALKPDTEHLFVGGQLGVRFLVRLRVEVWVGGEDEAAE